MKNKFLCLILILISLITVSVSADKMTLYENELSVVVEGTSSKDEAGKYVTAMLVKTSADNTSLSANDLAFIDQNVVGNDGSYKFEFKIDKSTNIDDYSIRINCGGLDISSSIKRAYVLDNGELITEITLGFLGNSVSFNSSVKKSEETYTDYCSYFAFYDENEMLIGVKTIKGNVDSENINFINGAHYAKLYVWNEKNIKPLLKSHYLTKGTPISTVEILYPGFTDKAVTFSYDDGAVSADTKLVEIFNEYGLKATFNINRADSAYSQIYNGHEVASHSKDHLNMFPDAENVASTEKCINSITGGKEIVESMFGAGSCKGFVWPYGVPNQREDFDVLMQTIKDNYDYCRNTLYTNNFSLPDDWYNWTPTCHHNNMNNLLDDFLADDSNSLKLFYIWGHAHEFTPDYGGDWSAMENFAEAISKENVWKATNGEIYDYVTASEKLVVNINNIYNPTDITVYAKVNGIETVIPAKSTAFGGVE